MTVDEVTFGGDIAAITSAMKEAVNQVEEHIHDVDVVPERGSRNLAHRVNDVSTCVASYLSPKRIEPRCHVPACFLSD